MDGMSSSNATSSMGGMDMGGGSGSGPACKSELSLLSRCKTGLLSPAISHHVRSVNRRLVRSTRDQPYIPHAIVGILSTIPAISHLLIATILPSPCIPIKRSAYALSALCLGLEEAPPRSARSAISFRLTPLRRGRCSYQSQCSGTGTPSTHASSPDHGTSTRKVPLQVQSSASSYSS